MLADHTADAISTGVIEPDEYKYRQQPECVIKAEQVLPCVLRSHIAEKHQRSKGHSRIEVREEGVRYLLDRMWTSPEELRDDVEEVVGNVREYCYQQMLVGIALRDDVEDNEEEHACHHRMHRFEDREVPIDLSDGLILVGGKGCEDGKNSRHHIDRVRQYPKEYDRDVEDSCDQAGEERSDFTGHRELIRLYRGS